jgi:hypothetical protein
MTLTESQQNLLNLVATESQFGNEYPISSDDLSSAQVLEALGYISLDSGAAELTSEGHVQVTEYFE